MKKVTEHDVVALRKEEADQLAAKGTGGAKVLCAKLMLILTGNALLDSHCLGRKRIVVIAIVEFSPVLKVDFENVVVRLTEEIVAGVLDTQGCLCT